MWQKEFAQTLGVPIGTMRNWKQNRMAMEPATIALTRILARGPEQLCVGSALVPHSPSDHAALAAA